jgi:hypothetical protein
MKPDNTRTAVVDPTMTYRDMSHCPIQQRVILLSQGGIAQVGTWDGRNTFFVGWHPLPVRKKESK